MLNSLQILRGCAAWAVVFTHIQQSYFMGSSNNSFWVFFEKHGGFGVDIFFVLSGFVMALVSAKYSNKGLVFGINRIYRLVPIYWFYTLLLILSIAILPTGIYLTEWEILSLLQSLLFIPNINPNGYGYYPTLYVGWTLIYEMFFYLMFSGVLLFKFTRPSIVCATVLISIAVLFRHNAFLGQNSLLLIEFSLGILICEYYKSTVDSDAGIKSVLPIVVFVGTTCLFLYLEIILFAKFFLAGSVVYSFILLERIFSKNYKLFKYLKVLGDHSYSTYLCHIVVIGWFYFILGNSDSTFIVNLGVGLIIVFILLTSKLSYMYIETSKHISKLNQTTIKIIKKEKFK